MLHLWHSRLLLTMVLFGAALELLLVGWATGAKVDNLKMAVVDHDQTPTSQGLIDALNSTGTLKLEKATLDQNINRSKALDKLFTGGNFIFNPDTILLVEIPQGFEKALLAGQQPTVNLTLNGVNSLGSTTARRAAEDEIAEIRRGDPHRSTPPNRPGKRHLPPIRSSRSWKPSSRPSPCAITRNSTGRPTRRPARRPSCCTSSPS